MRPRGRRARARLPAARARHKTLVAGHGRHGSMRSASFARRTVVEGGGASALERKRRNRDLPNPGFRVEISCAVIG